ncbi:hypothetical protein [Pseudanabaena sp. Chao 1811]|nr:hypothetical protein [Pseudanabaena sp. Chao 1811]
MTEPNDLESVLTPEELKAGRDRIAAANINNVLHHCRKCDYEWVASHAEACRCGSKNVERIMCWQFPDDLEGDRLLPAIFQTSTGCSNSL